MIVFWSYSWTTGVESSVNNLRLRILYNFFSDSVDAGVLRNTQILRTQSNAGTGEHPKIICVSAHYLINQN